MLGVDRNGKTFVGASIVASWRRREAEVKGRRRSSRREFQRRAHCGLPR
jgi:adenine-specific DNA methylase